MNDTRTVCCAILVTVCTLALSGCTSLVGYEQSIERGEIVNLADAAEFDAHVLQSRRPVLVVFYSSSCATCKEVLKSLPKLAQDYAGRADIVTLNIADARKTAGNYNVRYVPVSAFFLRGEERHRMVGRPPMLWDKRARKYLSQLVREARH